MAAIPWNNGQDARGFRHLENIALTNLVPGTSLAITKAVVVPSWATMAKWMLYVDLMTGTTPLIDFIVRIPDLGSTGTPQDGTLFGIAGWDGITQLTAAGSPMLVTVDMGPGITGIADDDAGSATASSAYHLNCILPPVLAYTLTFDATTNDEDYACRLCVQWAAPGGRS